MDRSGSIADVLSVAKELSNVQQSIEQIDAQLKNLQNQWNNSTHSLSECTVILLKLGIWLIVYSPYWLILVAAGYGFKRWRRNSRHVIPLPESANSDELLS